MKKKKKDLLQGFDLNYGSWLTNFKPVYGLCMMLEVEACRQLRREDG